MHAGTLDARRSTLGGWVAGWLSMAVRSDGEAVLLEVALHRIVADLSRLPNFEPIDEAAVLNATGFDLSDDQNLTLVRSMRRCPSLAVSDTQPLQVRRAGPLGVESTASLRFLFTTMIPNGHLPSSVGYLLGVRAEDLVGAHAALPSDLDDLVARGEVVALPRTARGDAGTNYYASRPCELVRMPPSVRAAWHAAPPPPANVRETLVHREIRKRKR
tara:strand:+ start:467 stop:1114 length:648 start_codon:yes stop_codon:yes gene_type:complete